MENAVLQASGKEKLTMLTMITGGLVKIIINWFLVAQRPVNIYGAPVGTLVSYAVMMLMNLVFIRGALRHKPDLAGIFAAPLVSSLLMGASAWAVYGLCGKLLGTGDRLHMLVCMAAAILTAVVVYAVAAINTRAVTADDMKLIPGGEKLARLLHMS